MKIALAYDRVNKWGGAERVLLALHRLFPDAPLYTSVYDRGKAPWANVFNVKTSFLQSFPFATNHELHATLMPIAFESFSFDEYDLVISVTSEAAKGILTKPKTKHICYSLTPTRYLWSGYEEYFKNPYFRLISKPAVSYLRSWDKIAGQRPDIYVAISKEVQSRIKRYYNRESVVVYPSVEISNSQNFLGRHSGKRRDVPDGTSRSASRISSRSKRFWTSQNDDKEQNNDYFLIVSRLVPYKKIDIVVKAFNKLKLPLKIVGVGSEMGRLKRMVEPTIEFLGNLTDRELVGYYMGCRGLIFPGIEDFGLTIVEAQSFGKPVIAFKGGGALETIIEGKTGLFFKEQTIESLSRAIEQFNNRTISPIDCIKNSEKFSFERFKKGFMNVIARSVETKQS